MEHIARLKRELIRDNELDYNIIAEVARLLRIDAQGMENAARSCDWNEVAGCDFDFWTEKVLRLDAAVARIAARRKILSTLPRVEEPEFR